MKKIYLFLALTAGLLVSCDMDKEPYGSLKDTEALQTPTDFKAMRVGLYSALRGTIGGNGRYTTPEVQCDGFHALIGNSNTFGDMYRWDFTPQNSTIDGVYGGYQSAITRANFIIDGYNKCDMSDKSLFTDAEMVSVRAAKGDAFFLRAYSIFMLSQFYCADYDASTADKANSGVSYRLDYAPSSNPSTYPGRKTLAETMAQVTADLDSAAKYVSEPSAALSAYITQDAITALRARQALAMDNYKDAAKYAEALISSGTYALAEGTDELKSMWAEDAGMETILQLAIASKSELISGLGTYYQPVDKEPDFVPTKTLVDLYSDKDYRKKAYFNQIDIKTTTGTSGRVYAFNKFPLETRLYKEYKVTEARSVIEPKAFRIAEMYLIAAEAYAQLAQTDQSYLVKAAQYINALEKKRIADYKDRSFSASTIMTELQNERQREMVGEGTRLFDLKRWHKNMERGEAQQEDLLLLPGPTTTQLERPAGDNRFTWPIPKHEMDVNKKMVQNPGY